jgi:hypothetical protein
LERATSTQLKPLGSDAPDGGAVVWLAILGAWCTSFCSFGWLNNKIVNQALAILR